MKLLSKGLLISIFALALIGLSACATDEDPYKNMSEQEIFTGGEKALNNGDYQEAISHFEAQEAKYPYGPYAQQEQLDIIYAYYENSDFASAQSAAERYIHLRPDDQNVDYAYYMRAMSAFANERTFLENYFPVDPALRDMQPNIQAFQYFNTVVVQYPQSAYATDARMHMVYIRNAIARDHVKAADYYYSRGAYVAALNRVQTVVSHYQQAPAVSDALVMMVKCYNKLGLTDDATAALKLLELNYPEKVKLVNEK